MKTNEWVKACDIASILRDKKTLEAVQFFIRFKRYGLPYSNWADCPNKLIEIVDLLTPLDNFYNPKIKL